MTDGMGVVALHDRHASRLQDGEDAIGMRAEAAEIAQAIRLVAAAPGGVVEDGLQRQVVVVDAAEDGYVVHDNPSAMQVRHAPQARRIGRSDSRSVPASRAPGASRRMGQVRTPFAVASRPDLQTSRSSISGKSSIAKTSRSSLE